MRDKLAIFDFDGTLFDTVEANWRAYRVALGELGDQFGLADYAVYCNGRSYESFLPEFFPELGVAEIEAVHRRKVATYPDFVSTIHENTQLFALLETIRRDWFTALATTASAENCALVLRHFQRADLFDRILTKHDTSNLKPAPDIFMKCMAEFAIPAERTLIFEDSPEGLEAARLSGARVLKVEAFVHSRAERQDR